MLDKFINDFMNLPPIIREYLIKTASFVILGAVLLYLLLNFWGGIVNFVTKLLKGKDFADNKDEDKDKNEKNVADVSAKKDWE